MAAIYDVAVIGGGPAGYVAAIKAAQLGGKVVLFEKDTVGGTCLNRGCIPTKTYIKTAEYIHNAHNAHKRGIHLDVSSLSVDMPKVKSVKDDVVKKLTGGVAGLLKAYGVEKVQDTARLAAPGKVEAGGKVWEAKNIILCGGSVAGRIPVPGMDHFKVVTSDGILEITEVPKRLVVIGGGVIGCEIATAFSAFGSQVTVVEAAPRIVSTMDADVSAVIHKALVNDGVTIMTDAKLESIGDEGGLPVLNISGGTKIQADLVLLSVGRTADLECMGALASQIQTERGKIVTDDHMRTNLPGIYAAGDLVAGQLMLAHAAFKMGEVAAANAMGHDEKANLQVVPGCLYTIPEAASVGLTEEQAAAQQEILVGRFMMGANGRSLASGESDGFIKVVADKKYGAILGVHMVCAAATEMIAEAASLMAMEITVHEAAEIIHPHPTFNEAFMEACADALGRCIHLPPKKR